MCWFSWSRLLLFVHCVGFLVEQFRSECLCHVFMFRTSNHSLTFRSRKALPMTETELRLIAAPAMIGLSSKPKNG